MRRKALKWKFILGNRNLVKNRILAMRTEVIFRTVCKDVLTKNKEQSYFCFIKILPTPTRQLSLGGAFKSFFY